MVADLFILSGAQQSNGYGYADWNATGGSTAGAFGSDFGFGINNTTSFFPAVTFNQRSSTAPSANAGTTQTYNINFADAPLKAFAAAGTTNMGYEQSLGRALIEWGIATAPYIAKNAIAGSSVPNHWAKLAAWGSIYTQWVSYAIAARATAGIDPVALVHWIGETDSGTPASITSAPADNKLLYDNFFADTGLPSNTPIIVMMINPAQTAGDAAGYRAAQLAWKALDSRVILIDLADVPLHADPHYDMTGQVSAGFRIATVIANLKGLSVRPANATSTTPTFRYDEACASAEVAPVASQPRSGPDPKVGDLELMPCWSYSAVVTHTLATAAGFLQLGSQADSAFSGTIHKAQSVYYRVLQESHFFVDASGRRRTITPAVTFATATLNIGKLITYTNVDPINPINAFVYGTQTTSTTTHTIPALTTTKPGCLVVLGGSDNGTNVSNSALTNAGLTGLTQRRDGRVNPGAGQVGYFLWDGMLAGTSLPTSAVTLTVASVVTSFAIALNPLGTATSTIDIGTETTSMTASAYDFANATIDIGTEGLVSTAIAAGTATSTIDIGTEILISTTVSFATMNATIDIGTEGVSSTEISGNPGHAKLYGLLQIDGSATPFNLVGPIKVYAGDSIDLVLTVTDDADLRFDLTSLTLELQIKKKIGDSDPLVTKTTANNTIQIRDQHDALRAGQADIEIGVTDLDQPPGLYWLDVVAINGSRRQHVVPPREFTIAAAVNIRD